ncbi:hypothetical protein SAMN05216553_1177 [Lentzea fradiae]|uniref:Uncharacterized protein n=1 Tax=Lentzea fradiae TaxID=200378 RepID=A0A1G8A6A9_9PSEU|nr:hypothetical protein [Lentzea fradiae]SDH16413.1 hypothetical protein SAMN05216553_1177 [Lentzea fradiae]
MPTSEQWLEVRAYLGEHRHAFAAKAAELYPDAPKVAGTPLLTAASWVPDAPVPLTDISLRLQRDAEFVGVDGTGGAAANVLPEGDYGTYSEAMAKLAAPKVFQNRSTYRLLDFTDQHLTFCIGSYFDGIDVGEACAHEYAARQLGHVDELRLRSAVADPCDPARRPMNVAISTLTIRHDRASGDATFFLHWRDPKRVGHAGGMYQVLPVGIFQASSDDERNIENDFSLWRCMIREFAEELLGESEEHDSPIDYDGWPFAKTLTDSVGDQVRVSYLGMGVDPLTFATDMLTVAVIEASLFDELFGDLVENNDEGRVLEGLAFTAENIERFVHREPTQAAGAALLALAWKHRADLLA